ncbi:MAG: hypothetical protein IT270_00490 [Saprospiraceae bacterium]|nr:hypothetical protein [Saprospiraceae bacterium]
MEHQHLPSFPHLEPLIEELDRLSGTAFNTVMLEVFRRRAAQNQPGRLLRQWMENRFVRPAQSNVMALKALELQWLQFAEKHAFKPVILSPVAPLGVCSGVAAVHQNNVVSSLRGTEVVSDATNVLALLAADFFKNGSSPETHYATTHRHLRAQAFDNPAFSAHFSAFCMLSAGKDTGSHMFEYEQLIRHIHINRRLITSALPNARLRLHWFVTNTNHPLAQRFIDEKTSFDGMAVSFSDKTNFAYYHPLQFKLYAETPMGELDLADGGVVSWVQQLTGNQKLRTVISGIGLELVANLQNGQGI